MNEKEIKDIIFNIILCNNESHRYWISDDEYFLLKHRIREEKEKLYKIWMTDEDIDNEIYLFIDTYLDLD